MIKDRFKNKVALVTGTTSGMGQAIAARLAGEGAVVACNHRPDSDPTKTLQMIKDNGGEGFSVAADMSDAKQVVAMVEETVKISGRLDYIVSNAAINPFLPWDQTSEDEYNRLMDTNVKGTWFVCTEGAKQMQKQGDGGAIVTISSISVYSGAPGQTAYCATKGAILSMTRALALDLGKYNIRANCILPGCIMTNMSKGLLDDDEAMRFYVERAAMRRVGYPDEIASVASFLLSDDAGFVTSAEILVDGGLLVNGEYEGPAFM